MSSSPFEGLVGTIRFGDASPIPVARLSMTVDGAAPRIPASGFDHLPSEFGFITTFDAEASEALLAMVSDAPVDPAVDKRWDAWRCPGCGRSHAEVGSAHAWRITGGVARCSGPGA